MARILVTGSTGFIGRHLVPALSIRRHEVVEAGRRPRPDAPRFIAVGEIGPATDWSQALADVDAVIHLAGLAHREAAEAEFFTVNDAGTRRLAEACHKAGVKVLMILSSIAAREAERDPRSSNAYGRSKLASETHARGFAESGGAGIILRPPLVYGHDAPGNWQRLQRLAASTTPLPFGAVRNRRSMCSVGNLSHAMVTSVEAALGGTGGGTFEVADREVVSLAQILRWLRAGMDMPHRLLPVPVSLMQAAARVAGREKLKTALLDDLTLDPSAFIRVFAWSPPETAEEAVKRSGQLYAANAGVRNQASAGS
ncbi:NAD-dependent epimerase/dehydratase family protein [Chelativorans sp. AA-79]|uniref:NAD-dependent epimerase/dehydratase family protein n=1 Tax=Chelativorans sp. AA-79 TaxID=3028735 RepID=UPI0023F77D9C|nr:NAD-dependent epimerase/dehydratase family protein [Chelativorans sp. AA-79]WEX09983.1 NAD-dependent epimerase/dehydratase family protein [Chelativorans sp. AA-79]